MCASNTIYPTHPQSEALPLQNTATTKSALPPTAGRVRQARTQKRGEPKPDLHSTATLPRFVWQRSHRYPYIAFFFCLLCCRGVPFPQNAPWPMTIVIITPGPTRRRLIDNYIGPVNIPYLRPFTSIPGSRPRVVAWFNPTYPSIFDPEPKPNDNGRYPTKIESGSPMPERFHNQYRSRYKQN